MLIPIDSFFLPLSLSSLFLHPTPFLLFFRPLCRRVKPRIFYPQDEFYRRFRELSQSSTNAENRVQFDAKKWNSAKISAKILAIRIIRFLEVKMINFIYNNGIYSKPFLPLKKDVDLLEAQCNLKTLAKRTIVKK